MSMLNSKITHRGLTLSGSDINKAYVLNKTIAFASAFLLTVLFNYSESLSGELTENEFLPSVKDVIASFYPNKALFQILMALCSFFQFVFSVILYAVFKTGLASFANTTGILSVLRLVSLLSFSYITVQDDISAFTNSYVLYVLTNAAWIYQIELKLNSRSGQINQLRRHIKNIYLGCLLASAFFFYRHQVEHTNLAYSFSSFFQWSMIGLDIFFDHTLLQEIKSVIITVDFPEGSLKKHIV